MDTVDRGYQRATVEDAVAFLKAAKPGDRRLYGSPTGSGKSYMEKDVLLALPGCLLVVPSVEIAAGLLAKMGDKTPTHRSAQEARGVYTSRRLYNLLMAAKIKLPKYLIFDEAHHSTDDTHETLHAITGEVPAVGFTATMFRGTPQETKKLHDSWPDRRTVLKIVDAVRSNVIAAPSVVTWPLLNDDLIDVSNGEFKVSSVDSVFRDKLDDIASRIGEFWDPVARVWDRPTMVAVSSVAAAEMLAEKLKANDFTEALVVTAKTNDRDRKYAFDACVNRFAVLIQINVVSEGVDLPIRRIIDLSPTMSPVRWVQRLGRCTRPVGPTEAPPEYICCCHNLTRHGYLWAGALPPAAFTDAQKAWGPEYKPSRKSLARAIGLDGFGRFQVNSVPTNSGLLLSLYALQTKDGLHQYAVVLSPTREAPWFFHKANQLTGEVGKFEKRLANGQIVEIEYRKKIYGPWESVARLPDLQGCVSIPEDRITGNMLDKWVETADKYGLDPEFEPDGRSFQILPIAWNTKVRFA